MWLILNKANEKNEIYTKVRINKNYKWGCRNSSEYLSKGKEKS